MKGQLSAEKHQTDQELVLFRGEQGQFRREGREDPDAELLHGMQGPFPGRRILPGKVRKFVEGFGVRVGAGGVKKAIRRKACERFLASLQLLGPQNAHGFVGPVIRGCVSGS
jgi:hypothetical protein